MGVTLWYMITAAFILVIVSYLMINPTYQFGTNSTVANLTGVAYNGTAFFQQTNSSIGQQAYSSNGLGANVQAFTGLGFVYPDMLGFATVMSHIGPEVSFLVSANIQTVGIAQMSGLPISQITGTFNDVIGLVLVSIFIAIYAKVDVLNVGR